MEQRQTNSSISDADIALKLIEAFVKALPSKNRRKPVGAGPTGGLLLLVRSIYLLKVERASRQARPERAAASLGAELYGGPSLLLFIHTMW